MGQRFPVWRTQLTAITLPGRKDRIRSPLDRKTMWTVQIDRRAFYLVAILVLLLVPLALGALVGGMAGRSSAAPTQAPGSLGIPPTIPPLAALDQALGRTVAGQSAVPTPNPTMQAVPRITVAEAAARIDDPAVVFVDARDADAFALGHIRGAILIPEPELPSRMASLHKDAEIIIYCECWAEEIAAREALILLDNGFTDVKALQGGWRAWLDGGYPTELGDGS